MSRPKEWTPQMDAFLRNNVHLGGTAIGAALGRSPLAVRQRACKIGVRLGGRRYNGRRPSTPATSHPLLLTLLDAAAADLRPAETICKDAGVASNTLCGLRRGKIQSSRLVTFEALAGALGYRLALVREGAQ